VFGFTLGSMGEQGRGFTTDLMQVSSANFWSVIIGGIIFNASNILLSASISIAGMAVAFPVGVGLALVLGVVLNYNSASKDDPILLFTGVALIVVAIVFNGIASGKMSSG
jgi:glucose uptake protein